jgi:TolA-binding protein
MRHSLILFCLMSAVATGPLLAQDSTTVVRVEKLEKEMKAVQRKVFPNGKLMEPEIGPTETGQGGVPSSGPIIDLTARVDALENQMRSMTGQIETNTNRIKKLEDALKKMQAGEGAPVASSPTNAPAKITPAVTDPELPPVRVASTAPVAPPVTTAKPAAPKSAIVPPKAPATRDAPIKIDPKRKAAVAAIEIPDTGDATEDSYTYGFRLWNAKFYPEAQVKLKEFMDKYPKHRRASYAQNLLGRAYMDEGKTARAAVAFYENYTKNPKGERAAESLYYLGVVMTKRNELDRACKVYDEFNDVYGASASSDLKTRVTKGRTDAKCTG